MWLHRASRSRLLSPELRPTARRSTAPSTVRAAQPRRSRAPPRNSPRCALHSTRRRYAACSPATPSRGARRRSQSGEERCGSAQPRSVRWRPSRQRSASASGRGRAGMRRGRSPFATCRPAACSSRSASLRKATPRRCNSPSPRVTSSSASAARGASSSRSERRRRRDRQRSPARSTSLQPAASRCTCPGHCSSSTRRRTS